jgi:hypothetical protein
MSRAAESMVGFVAAVKVSFYKVSGETQSWGQWRANG